MRRTIITLSQKFKVVLVEPIPNVGWDVPAQIFKEIVFAAGVDISTPYSRYTEENAPILTLFRDLDSYHAAIISVRSSATFCSADRCNASIDGVALYLNDDHPAHSTGATLLAPFIAEAVLSVLQETGDAALESD